jgi:membrane-associated phospholipid phosphatase
LRCGRRGATALVLVLVVTVVRPAAADAVETSGDVLRWAIPATAGAIAWRRGDDEGLRQYAVAFAGTAVSTLALKELIDKERPNGDSKAFPSGHAATSFAGATFLHRRYGWRGALPAYALSAYVGWTRLDADEHEIEDVLGGAALAAAWTWWLVDPEEPPAVVPVVSRDGIWLRYTARW